MSSPSPITLEWTLNRRSAAKQKPVAPGVVTQEHIPRLARLMALAIKFDGLVRQGVVRDYADLARLGHVSRARITQIMNLLNLAPDIQENLLFFSPGCGNSSHMTEPMLREVIGLPMWTDQRDKLQSGVLSTLGFAKSHGRWLQK